MFHQIFTIFYVLGPPGGHHSEHDFVVSAVLKLIAFLMHCWRSGWRSGKCLWKMQILQKLRVNSIAPCSPMRGCGEFSGPQTPGPPQPAPGRDVMDVPQELRKMVEYEAVAGLGCPSFLFFVLELLICIFRV